MKKYFAVLLVILAGKLLAQTQSIPPVPSSNADLKALVQEDQLVRSGPPLTTEERTRITRTDTDRLVAVKKIIAANRLLTSEDYRNAAIILQHGSTSDDYLLSHTFAVIAISKGDKTSIWLNAASLDRYLVAIKQPQNFGTQYNHFDQTKPWTQAPYDSGLITDNVRKELNFPSLIEQKKRLDSFNDPSARE